MPPKVVHHVARVRECLAALGALVRLLPSVGPEVQTQRTTPCKLLAAHGALVRLLSRVSSEMCPQSAGAHTLHVALRALALVLPLYGMDLDM